MSDTDAINVIILVAIGWMLHSIWRNCLSYWYGQKYHEELLLEMNEELKKRGYYR